MGYLYDVIMRQLNKQKKSASKAYDPKYKEGSRVDRGTSGKNVPGSPPVHPDRQKR